MVAFRFTVPFYPEYMFIFSMLFMAWVCYYAWTEERKQTFIKGLLCAKQCVKHFTEIIQFDPHYKPVRQLLLSSLCYR